MQDATPSRDPITTPSPPHHRARILIVQSRGSRIAFAEDGYQDLLTRGGLEKKPHPSLEGVRNVQRLMQSSNPRVGEIKLKEIVDRGIMRKLDDSGFIDRIFAAAGVK
jgi:hypothetical protein